MNVAREIITSKQNDRIKFLCKLRDRTKRNRYKMFLIEGCRELSRAIDCDVVFDTIFFCEKFFKSETQKDLISQADFKQIKTCEVSDDVFEKISNRENYDGVVGLAKFWATDLAAINLSVAPFVLVSEGIEKAGNLGALMRSAESAGVDSLILCNPVTDIFNPNVVRASQGAVFNLPIAVSDNESVMKFFKKNGVTIFATTPSSEKLYFEENFSAPTAIVVGAEHDGLSDFWLKNPDVRKVSLPQRGICDSLNVNDAAVIVLYEVLRQRMCNV